MYLELCGLLGWSPTALPRSQLIAVTDEVAACGDFVIVNYISMLLKEQHRVCVISSYDRMPHYSAILRRLV